MNEYALLVDGQFVELRYLESKPVDIPHKKVKWYNVVREFGTPTSYGVANGVYKMVEPDPNNVQVVIPNYISARQCRLMLLSMNKLADAEAMVAASSDATKVNWEYATEFDRNHPLLVQMATAFGMSSQDLDNFFIAAAQIT